MAGDVRVAHPDVGAVGGGVEPQEDPASTPAPGYEEGSLVPHVTDVVMKGRVDELVVVTAGNRHLSWVGQGCAPPPSLTADAVRVGREAPESVESLHLAGRIVLWLEHRPSVRGVRSGAGPGVREHAADVAGGRAGGEETHQHAGRHGAIRKAVRARW